MSNRSKKTVVAEKEPTFVDMCAEKWKKGCQRGARWDKETFDEFPACVYWFRQILAAVVGIALGVMGVVGSAGVAGGFGLVTGVTHAYYSYFIEADEQSYGESGLKMEGTFQSFAVFLLWWIVAYTGMGHAEKTV